MNRFCAAILNKMIHTAFLIIFSICAFFTLFHFERYSLLFQHSISKTFLFCVTAAFIFMLWGYTLSGKNIQVCNRIRITTIFILLTVQVLLFLKIITPIGWDVMEVVNSAEFGMYNGDYFVKYPNNLFLHLLLSFYLKMTGFIPYLSSLRKLELLNLFFVDISIFMSALTVKKIYGTAAADRVFISAVLLIAFHPTLSVVYSDTLAMPFPIGTLLCFVYGTKSDKTWKRILFFSAGAALCIIGCCIKPTVIIIAIAIIILSIFHWKRSFFSSNILIPVLTAILAGSAVWGTVNLIELPVKRELEIQYPEIRPRDWSHHVALGLSVSGNNSFSYGSWNREEVQWMQQHINDSNYTQESINHIKDKLVEFGPAGYVCHLANKLIWAGSDGTFFYGGEGDFHAQEQSPQNTLRGKLQNAFYIETEFYQKWFSSWMQGIWLFICIRAIVSCFPQKYNKFDGIAKLAIEGLFLFLLIFENRSRYLFLYLPVLLTAIESDERIRHAF